MACERDCGPGCCGGVKSNGNLPEAGDYLPIPLRQAAGVTVPQAPSADLVRIMATAPLRPGRPIAASTLTTTAAYSPCDQFPCQGSSTFGDIVYARSQEQIGSGIYCGNHAPVTVDSDTQELANKNCLDPRCYCSPWASLPFCQITALSKADAERRAKDRGQKDIPSYDDSPVPENKRVYYLIEYGWFIAGDCHAR